MENWLKAHYKRLILPIIVLCVMLWVGGCPPRTRSPINPSTKLTLPELNAELNNLIDRYEIAIQNIEEQERIRKLIISNALMIAESGSINPLGLITALAGAYGITRVSSDTVNTIKKRKKKT